MPKLLFEISRKYLLLSITLIVAGWLSTPLAYAWYPYSEKYDAWQAERPFLLGGLHNSTPQDKLDFRLQRFKAAGLNTFIWAKPWNATHFFKKTQHHGLQWACWLRNNPDALRKVMEIPGNSFVMTNDEPSTEEELVHVGKLAKWLRQTYPDTIQFVNLSITKIDHDRLIELCQPDVFSFDHYPLQRNGVTHLNYLYDLDWGRQTASKYNLPYWIYLQATGREQDNPTYAYRVPDEADMRFLVYTFLAHGGTGIQFYMYYGHDESMVMDTEVENMSIRGADHRFENSVVTRAWHAIRDVAPEIQHLGTVLVNLRSKGHIGYTGNGELWDHPAPSYRIKPSVEMNHGRFRRHEHLKEVEIIDGTNRGIMIAFFDDEAGEEYFMVVNMLHGTNMSKMDGARRLRLLFSSAVKGVERLNRFSGQIETLNTKAAGSEYRILDILLEGGTGDLFKWSNGKPWAKR
tara:strand:- start:3170 stop:4549 length:1380 start_codon:yes stop_codon:yes gene_type:complete